MESEIVLLGIALAGLMTMGILKITSSAGRTREEQNHYFFLNFVCKTKGIFFVCKTYVRHKKYFFYTLFSFFVPVDVFLIGSICETVSYIEDTITSKPICF